MMKNRGNMEKDKGDRRRLEGIGSKLKGKLRMFKRISKTRD